MTASQSPAFTTALRFRRAWTSGNSDGAVDRLSCMPPQSEQD